MGLLDEALAQRVRNGQVDMMIPRELWCEIRETVIEFRKRGEPLEPVRRAVCKRIGANINRESFRLFAQRLIDDPPKPQGPAADAKPTRRRQAKRKPSRQR